MWKQFLQSARVMRVPAYACIHHGEHNKALLLVMLVLCVAAWCQPVLVHQLIMLYQLGANESVIKIQ